MSIEHVVVQGECLSVIAARFGFRWQPIWNAPENADLRQRRQSPNILFPGDVVVIPDVTPKSLEVPLGAVSRLVIAADKVRLRIRIVLNDAPMAGESYTLVVDG